MSQEDFAYFTEENSAEVVISRIENAEDERMKQIMAVIIRHLHAAVKEIEPTHEEWFKAIRFLTATGHKCDDWRQEYILLSDVLGVSMLVDAINSRRPTGSTENTVLGPFHIQGAPEYEMGANICLDGKGEPMLVHGRITDVGGQPLPGAKLDVWQANDDGFYDVQQKSIQPDFNLRGVFRTGADGKYSFWAVRPKHYSIPTDGPVGAMMKKLGRHAYRPAHLHYIVSKPGYETLTTHVFDPHDPYIHSDAVFGVKESLIVEFHRIDDERTAAAAGIDNPFWNVEFDCVLAPAAT
ncbi:MAG: 6-chlorohydroxyquinol-1,2-dioxygenase [Gammaproteobacteria bacterium]|nr:6-chlorohydroxyquinol-1,2-dioxygenase [Gammaproteobacteria bacterium]